MIKVMQTKRAALFAGVVTRPKKRESFGITLGVTVERE